MSLNQVLQILECCRFRLPRGLRRTLEGVTGPIDSAEVGPTLEEECLVQKLVREPGQISLDEIKGLALDSKLVADATRKS